jgi:hypothetical protein
VDGGAPVSSRKDFAIVYLLSMEKAKVFTSILDGNGLGGVTNKVYLNEICEQTRRNSKHYSLVVNLTRQRHMR